MRIGAERLGVEEVVVDAAVDHVARARRPLVVRMKTVPSRDDEVAAFDQLDAHLLGEEAVLEVRRVVDAGREQHDHWRVATSGAAPCACSVSSSWLG